MTTAARIPAIAVAVWISTLAAAPPASSPDHSALLSTLTPGAHRVGFTVLRMTDPSRRFGASQRPVQISVWYPAALGASQQRMTYRDYLRDLETEADTRPLTPQLAAKGVAEGVAFFSSLGATNDAIERLMAEPTLAFRDAPRGTGRYPAVLLAVGKDESPVLHTVLAEYLASHGFAVAGIPTVGANSRGIQFDTESVRSNVGDLEFAARVLLREHLVAPGPMGVVGYSFGGGSALLLAARHGWIGAAVSLDGAIGFADRRAIYELPPALPTQRPCAPLMHVNVSGNPRNDLVSVDRLACGPRYVLGFAGAEHADFSSIGLFEGVIENFRGPGWILPRSTAPARTTALAYRYTLHFLDAYLRGNVESTRFLMARPEANGAPNGTLDISRTHISPGSDLGTSLEPAGPAGEGLGRARRQRK